MKEIIIATKNRGKVKDFEGLFAPLDIKVTSLLDIEDIEDIEETGTTFEENAAIKAEAICKVFGIPVIADDSGLEVDALNGEPGVYSARYAGEQKDDKANLQKVLTELAEVPEEKRTARFVCVLAIATPGESTVFKRGECAGMIGREPAGENGFGYDPIFYPIGSNNTMAQMTPDEKNKISHRRNALDQLINWVKEM